MHSCRFYSRFYFRFFCRFSLPFCTLNHFVVEHSTNGMQRWLVLVLTVHGSLITVHSRSAAVLHDEPTCSKTEAQGRENAGFVFSPFTVHSRVARDHRSPAKRDSRRSALFFIVFSIDRRHRSAPSGLTGLGSSPATQPQRTVFSLYFQ